MGVAFYKAYVCLDGDGEPVYWVALDKDKADEFIKQFPMPESETFNDAEEILINIAYPVGPILLRPTESLEFIFWFEDLISHSLVVW